MNVTTTAVSSWGQLMEELYRESWNERIQRFRSPFVYRGMGNVDNVLSPSLMRLAEGHEDISRLETHLLRNFRKYAHADAAAGDSIWNWLALAAHHGLPTRLLDWTYSPFVALHFATENVALYDCDAVVWCVNHRETNRRLPPALCEVANREGSDVFTVDMLSSVASSLEKLEQLSQEDFVVYMEPPSLDARIVNQFALFSLMSKPGKPLDEWLGSQSDLSRRIVIPASLKWEVRDKLDQAGVTERMLFPGLDGLSAWLARYYMPKTNSKKRWKGDDSTRTARPRPGVEGMHTQPESDR